MNEPNVFTDIKIPEIVYENYIEDKLEQDLMIPDYYSSARKIVCCNADAIILNKRFSDGKILIEGICCWKILYLSDEDEILHQISCERTFAEYFSSPVEDGTIRYKVKVKNANCKLHTARKAECKCLICIAVKVEKQNEKKMFVACSDPDTQLRKSDLELLTVLQQTEKEFKVTCESSIRNPEEYSVFSVQSSIVKRECKCCDDKLLIKGICENHVVLIHREKMAVENIECETTFSQIIEIENCNENCCANVSFAVLDVNTAISSEDETLMLHTTVQLQCSVFLPKTVSLCIDAYHPERKIETSVEKAELYCNVCYLDVPIRLNHTIHMNTKDIKILFSQAKGDIEKIDIQDNVMIVEGIISVVLIYSIESEVIQTGAAIPFQTTKSVDFDFDRLKCDAEVVLDKLSYIILSESEVEISCEAKTVISASIVKEIDCITNISVTDEMIDNSLDATLVVYYASKGESIWDIGKTYSVPIEVLKNNNRLDQDILLKPQPIFISKR